MGEIKARTRVISRGWMIALATVVILAVAAVVTVTILNRERTAVETAQEYFEALAAGDASTANSLSRGWVENDQIVSLLTDQALGVAVEHISDVSVVAADSSDTVTDGDVVVTYTLAGARHTVPLTLNKGTPEWGFLHTWELNPPYSQTGRIPYPSYDKVSIEGLAVEGNGEQWVTGSLYPGVYRLVSSDPHYYGLTSDEFVVDGVSDFPSVELVPTPELVAAVQGHINGVLDECVDNSFDNAGARGCPLVAFLPGGDNSDGTWEIVEYPSVELSQVVTATAFGATGGRAQFTPRGSDEPVEMERELSYTGWVNVEGGAVEVRAIFQY